MSTRARINLWAAANGIDVATVTATYDGERIVEINGSAAAATEAMAISQANVDSEDAAMAAAQAAADAAARAAYLEGFDQLPRPIRGIVETDGGDGHVYVVAVDGAGGEVIPIQRESTRLTNAELEAAKTAARAARQTHRGNIAAIQTDLDQVKTAINGLDLTNAGPLGTAIAATSAPNKAAFNQIQNALQAIAMAVKNLTQASEKIRREIK